jgi:FdhE protein
MIEQTIARLDQLARTDAAVASLARVRGEALRASARGGWDDGVPELDRRRAEDGIPLLHGQTLRADGDRVRRLLVRLAKLATRQGTGVADEAAAVGRAVQQGSLDAASLLRAAVVEDSDGLARLAEEVAADFALLATLGQLAALPLLQACGHRAGSVLDGVRWDAGYCPVCAAWPTLSELRGLDRTRWLRCGRCGSGWSCSRLQCPYCANSDHRKSGYLAPERERESRRAMVCDACRSYVKAITTIRPIAPAEIGLVDAQTLEFDVAALEHGYGRPGGSGFRLDVSVELTESRSPSKPWRRKGTWHHPGG